MHEANNPLVSVVILNYRRREELVRVVGSVFAQEYQPREIIVVDNASGDSTAEFVAERFPEVRVLVMPENLGCGGRNRGIEAARGQYVVTLDNDVRFETTKELERIVAKFQERPEAAILVFKILHDQTGRLHLRDWCHPRSAREYSDREFETYYIAEGASAIRRSDFLRLGGYYEPFRIGGEGWDLALRVLDAGLKILYCPSICVRHAMAMETRGGRRPYYFYTRNSIWTAFKDYSGWRLWKFLAYTFAKMLYFCSRPSRFPEVLKGARDGFASISRIHRTTITEEGWHRLEEVSAHRPGWWTRLKTHWAQPEI